MRILVTDGEDRAALAACRGLWRAGHTVAVAAGVQGAATHASRACSARLVLPRSLSADEFVAALAAAVRRTRYDLLLPASDAALLAVSRSRERLPSLLLRWLPPDETVVRTMQKAALIELLRGTEWLGRTDGTSLGRMRRPFSTNPGSRGLPTG